MLNQSWITFEQNNQKNKSSKISIATYCDHFDNDNNTSSDINSNSNFTVNFNFTVIGYKRV